MRWGRAALFAALLGCSRNEPPGAPAKTAAAPPPSSTGGAPVPDGRAVTASRLPAEERTWTLRSPVLGEVPVVVLLPERSATERFPVLVTMHGRGEALKGPARGARGWVDDYGLTKVIARLGSPPLTKTDFLSFVNDERLERINGALADKPYRGLVIVCPYVPPDILKGERFFDGAEALAELFVRDLLPRVYRETPAIGSPASTGLDGVSLGGRASYSVGLLRPEAFGVVAALQAAFDVEEVPLLVPAAVEARRKNPVIRFRMLTSHEDYFREPDRAIARAFSDAGLPMTFDVVSGPHDYAFNRGPGAIEMLVFHDRALRGDPLP